MLTMIPDRYKSKLEFLGPELVGEMEEKGSFLEVPEGQVILREGQYVNVVPFVLEGLIKVYIRDEKRELLLYYIGESQSCIMSFYAVYENSVSQVIAETVEPTTMLALPADAVNLWASRHPPFTRLLYGQYNLRYEDLLNTIHELLFLRLDERLVKHLRKLNSQLGGKPIVTTHQQLADDLGTAREVISRALKKLELEGFLQQTDEGIAVKAE